MQTVSTDVIKLTVNRLHQGFADVPNAYRNVGRCVIEVFGSIVCSTTSGSRRIGPVRHVAIGSVEGEMLAMEEEEDVGDAEEEEMEEKECDGDTMPALEGEPAAGSAQTAAGEAPAVEEERDGNDTSAFTATTTTSTPVGPSGAADSGEPPTEPELEPEPEPEALHGVDEETPAEAEPEALPPAPGGLIVDAAAARERRGPPDGFENLWRAPLDEASALARRAPVPYSVWCMLSSPHRQALVRYVPGTVVSDATVSGRNGQLFSCPGLFVRVADREKVARAKQQAEPPRAGPGSPEERDTRLTSAAYTHHIVSAELWAGASEEARLDCVTRHPALLVADCLVDWQRRLVRAPGSFFAPALLDDAARTLQPRREHSINRALESIARRAQRLQSTVESQGRMLRGVVEAEAHGTRSAIERAPPAPREHSRLGNYGPSQ